MSEEKTPRFFHGDPRKVIAEIGKEEILGHLKKMLLIRNFEMRGEQAYQQGKVGGFYHSYMGQEAIQVGCLAAVGSHSHWFTTTYRCHALALLLGVTPNEAMAELYGRATGNALGRGGSMHLYGNRMLGGLAIVGGHVPIATGAAFSIKYQKQKGALSFCFLGDGAVVQGAVHESLNIAALWHLPCVYVVENNHWGMGTAVSRAVCIEPIAENLAKSYGIRSYTVDGANFFDCYSLFKEVLSDVLERSEPVLIEAITERFRGHSISDPGLYRTKEELAMAMDEKDPIRILKLALMEAGLITEEKFKVLDKEQRDIVIAAMKFADDSPWPDPIILEEGVFAQEGG
ncbi:MAG: pyruvate dehydrogenase (acetyl-transferring) E1 component subunit alpha [Chlamydiae bacterium RIFCSPHIGHO2_12_FULL_44_59]|nr:MAG: pyruvate dehydrogenase (acetyl-transferring) E1 component subunit alpha [Chlamydiae bacterium RIFCSPHIGHO2_01_FULL_44_39]OGN60766.1 MAG: pyruvate dehydrogenase (acetyl-transferring) E1 component subunit alpha [Chlamydiae bacterium RIFCSPHIGHO2_12_FULL_44_59]OGN67026.1 MAG: pyruvate dehydrogenase (acetyl-transferring) E1 component subunit alpha [Chlamydiae bacterium RIFCSPLOWO2_01_FULL_44_52]OGN67579.1 MAG: pyruvate dehydrogenase (acetyl-transferring) E1 component subunit alpha [Chlamydia